MVCTEERHTWFLLCISNYNLDKEKEFNYFALCLLLNIKEYLCECMYWTYNKVAV